MDHRFPPKMNGKPRVLVAPLDWGLGHATRCIPLIRELLTQGAEVWLAGEEAQEHLLKTEFPQIPWLSLRGYRIKYARTQRGLVWKMISQGPKMRRAIQYEHRWLKKMMARYAFDAVISDNRYGLSNKATHSVFITHQLHIKSRGGAWVEKIFQRRNYRFIANYIECWVPDNEGRNQLAGELSHPKLMPPVPVKYIGWLSRFEQQPAEEKAGWLLIMLSGPEPQRTLLENNILNEIAHYPGQATIVRGLPGHLSIIPSTNMIRFYNHLSAAELEPLLQEAEFLIGRSGYSTVMDAMILKKKCIFIPTPGQTEQEYLGNYLMGRQIAISIPQNEFSLQAALNKARQFPFRLPETEGNNLYKEIIRGFLEGLMVSHHK
jgi:hypothetical protein